MGTINETDKILESNEYTSYLAGELTDVPLLARQLSATIQEAYDAKYGVPSEIPRTVKVWTK